MLRKDDEIPYLLAGFSLPIQHLASLHRLAKRHYDVGQNRKLFTSPNALLFQLPLAQNPQNQVAEKCKNPNPRKGGETRMKLTKEEQEERWPNLMAITAGQILEEDLDAEQLNRVDEFNDRLKDPEFQKFMTGIIGPTLVKIAKAKA
jgi:hypothetical protein